MDSRIVELVHEIIKRLSIPLNGFLVSLSTKYLSTPTTLSIPLNGFLRYYILRESISPILSIPLNGFEDTLGGSKLGANMASFNSIEWIPRPAILLGNHSILPFNSIEWIQVRVR